MEVVIILLLFLPCNAFFVCNNRKKMDMAELNRNLEDYKLNELFDLAAWMHGEEFSSTVIFKKKKLVVEMLANQLCVADKEIYWILEAKEKRKLKIAMGERDRENAAMEQHNKNWELSTHEVKMLTQQNIELMNQNQEIINALKKMEEKIAFNL